jgi:hypothetical protein
LLGPMQCCSRGADARATAINFLRHGHLKEGFKRPILD